MRSESNREMKRRTQELKRRKSCTPEGVDQRGLLDGGLVQQGGEQRGVRGDAVEAAVEE